MKIRGNFTYTFFLTLCFAFSVINTFAQRICNDVKVPYHVVDLTGQPGGSYVSPLEKRDGKCCGSANNEGCVEFELTLDAGAQGIRFTVDDGAAPTGSLKYKIGCPGVEYDCGVPICLNGVGPHHIIFCKPGSNENSYKIESIPKPSVSGNVYVSDGCTSSIISANFDPTSIVWSSAQDPTLKYLTFPSGKATAVATYQAGAPATVTYTVCGTPLGGCSSMNTCLNATVHFVSTLAVTISPINPTICFGGTSTPLTANETGGAAPFSYKWTLNGANVGNTKVINASTTGTYIVTVSDGTSCPTATASVVVTAYASPITANAGPDKNSCANNSSVTLNGSVQQATGGIWTGGAGTFNPSNTSLTPIYIPTGGEIATGTVNLTLTTTGNGTCPSAADQMVITIAKTPIVSAGPNQSVCGNNAKVTLAGSVTNAGGGRWSGGAGTYFPNDSTLNAIYTPTAAEITTGTVNLILTSIQNGACTPVTSPMQITITPAPIVNAGIDKSVCANNSVAPITGTVTNTPTYSWSIGTGTYSPNNTSLSFNYTPSAAEITAKSATLRLTATKAGCLPVSDDMILTITDAPTVNAGPDVTACGNNPNVILNGAVTVATGGIWSGGAGTFSPNANTLNATYIPTAGEISTGSVTLTLTTTGFGTCNPVFDQVKISYSVSPTANANVDQTVCGNKSAVNLNGSVTVATGGTWAGGTGTFSPNANTLNATYTPSATEITAGTVTLTLNTTGNGLCNVATDQMKITITPAPTANANVDQSVCANKAPVTLNGSVTVATGGTWSTGGSGTFNNPNALNAVYTPSATDISNGTVTLTLTTSGNGNCNPVTDQMIVTITPAPTINANVDQTVCENKASVTLNGLATVATGGTWSGGAGTFTPNALNSVYQPTAGEITAGTVTLTLTSTGNGTCNAVTDQMKITITKAPLVNAGSDQAVCANNANINLSGTVTIASGGIWSALGSGSFVPNNTTLTTTYIPSAGDIATGISRIVLTSTGNGLCNAVTDTMLVIITPAPTANAGIDKTVCANNASVNVIGTVVGTPSFTWSGGNGTYAPNNTTLNFTYTPSASEITAGTVTLTLTANKASAGCIPVTDQMVITITPAPTINAGPDQSVCGNNAAVTLAGTTTVATGGTWSVGTGTYTPNALNSVYQPTAGEISAGTVTLTLTSTGNGTCNAVTDQMIITITPAPTITAGPDQTVCGNKATAVLSGAVTVSSGGTWSGGTGTYSLTPNSLTPSYTPSAAEITAGSANLTITSTGNANCLPVNDQMKITITPAPVVNAGADFDICANNPTAQLNGSVTVSTGGVWSGGNGTYNPNNTTLNAKYTPTATEISNGSVTLTLTSTGNGNCNQVSDNVLITITTAPTANAGSDQTVCGNAGSVPLNGAVTVATGGTWSTNGTGTFLPNATTLNASYKPSNADTTSHSVTLTLTTSGNGKCNAVTDQMTMNFSSVPSANAGPNKTVCTNDLPISLNGTGSAGAWVGGTGTFTPSRSVLNPTYNPSAAEKTANSVTLTYATNSVGACPSVSSNITITIPPGPIVNAGSDITVCGDVNSVALSGSVQNAGGGQWTSNGTGTFTPNATTLNASYNPSATDKANGSVTLTLTSTSNGSCTAETDQMILTITPAPTVNAGPDQTFCSDITTINLTGSKTVASGVTWSGGTAANFSPSITTANATYKPTAAEKALGSLTLTLTTTGNGTCNAVSDNVIFTFTPAPTISAGADQTICANKSSTALTGTVSVATGVSWSTSGTGIFSIDNVSLNTNYNPSAADTTAHTVKIFITSTGNGTCLAVKDTMIITINPKPVVDAGTDQTYCSDIANAPLTGKVFHATGGQWSTSGSGTFTPSNTDLNAAYVPSATDKSGGIVTLTLTSSGNGLCNAVSDQVVLNFTPAPTITVGPDRIVCAGSPIVSLGATITVASGVTWSTTGSGTFSNITSLNPTYTASNADTTAHIVTLTATTTGNGTCIPVSDNLIVTIDPKPIVNAGNDVTICGDVTSVILNGSKANATGVIWSGGTGSFSPNTTTLNATYFPSAAEKVGSTVTLTLTSSGSGTCPAESDQMNIIITPAPTVNAGSDQTVCADIGSVSLTGTTTVATGGTWKTSGTGAFANANNLITTYTPSQTDINNGVVILTLKTTGNGTCNPVMDQLTLTITPAPTITAGPDKNVCASQNSIVLNGAVTVATGGTWSILSGTGTFSPNANTLNANYIPTSADTTAHSVILVLTTTGNGTCKPLTDTMQIKFNPIPVVYAGADHIICADATIVDITDSHIYNATGGSWISNGSGTFTPNAFSIITSYVPSAADKLAGNVTLTLTSTGSGLCAAVQDQMVIKITPAPTVTAGPDQTVCATTAGVQLAGNITVASGGTWTTASGAGSFVPDANTLNAVFVPAASQIAAGKAIIRLTTTGNGTCNAVTSTMTLTISPAPVVSAGPNQTVCANSSTVALTGTVTNATGGTWTTTGTGSFSNANALITNYIPSAADISAGFVTLTLKSTGNGACSAVSSNTTIGFQAVPFADAGPASLCTNMSGLNLSGTVQNASGGRWTTSGSGTFSPSANILNPKYTPSAADQTAGSIYLYFRSSGNGSCPAYRDSILVGIQLDPTSNAGSDQIVCADIAAVPLTGAITNAAGATWSSSGGGSFTPNSSTLNAGYVLSAIDKINGTVTLTLTTIPNGICPGVSDQMIVTITPAPTVIAGPNQTICADAAGVTLNGNVTIATGGNWTTNGSGTFTPSSSALNATYVPSAADTAAHAVKLTLTTTGNGTCNAVSDVTNLTITPAPTIKVGADDIICSDINAYILNAQTTVAGGASWISKGTGSFTASTTPPSTTYIFSAADKTAGLVQIIATTFGNGTCEAVTDTINITIKPAPTVVASAGNACADADTVQLAGAITVATGATWTTTGSGVFVPNTTTLNAKYVPSAADKAAGSVILTLTTTGSGSCNEVYADVTLNIVPSPIANAGTDQTVCGDIGSVTLNGSIQHAGGGIWSTLGTGSFTSSTTTLNNNYTLSNADTTAHTVTLVLTTTGTGSCNPVTDTLKVKILPAPIVDAGPSIICQSTGSVNLNGIVYNASGGIWSTVGDGVFGNVNNLITTYTPGPNDKSSGSVVIKLSAVGIGTCKPTSDNITINIQTAPVSKAGSDQTLCADVKTISLSGTILNAGGGTWTTLDGTGAIASPSSLNTNYNVTTADTTRGFVTFYLTTTGNGVCLPVIDTLLVTLTDAPTVNPGPANVCSNNPPVALNGSVTTATGGKWTTSGDGTFANANSLITNYTPGASDNSSGIVVLTLTTTGMGTCNAVSGAITLRITADPKATAGPGQTICADAANITLNGTVSGATGGQWISSGSGSFNPNNTTLNATYAPSAADTTTHNITLTLVTTGVGACNPDSSKLTLTINPTPTVFAGADQTVCGDIAAITLNGKAVHATGGTWSTPNGTGSFANASNLSTTYAPTSADTLAGKVTFVLTSTGMGTCNAVKDTMIVTITDAPFITAIPTQLCSDAISIPVKSIKTVATGVQWSTTGTGTFAPNNLSLNTFYVPSAGDRAVGFVQLNVTTTGNGTCKPVTDDIQVFLRPGPIANAGGDQGICADAGTLNVTGSVLNAPGGAWSTLGSGTFSNPNALSTTYNLSKADTAAHIVKLVLITTGVAPCTPVTDTITINITPAPVAIVNAGNDTTVCADNATIPLTGTIHNAAGGMWSTNGSGIFTPNAFELNATYLPSGSDLTAGTITLVLESTGNGICSPITDTMQVTITPRPTVSINPNPGIIDTVCADVAGIPINALLTTATKVKWFTSGTGTFTPADNVLNPTYIPSAADTADRLVILTVQTIDNGACSAVTDNKQIIVTPAPRINAGFDQLICADADSIQLSGSVIIASGGTWTSGGTGTFSDPNILNPYYRITAADTTAGSVTLTFKSTGNGRCNQVSDQMVITISDAPKIDAGPDQTICADNSSISLNGTVTVANGVQWISTGTGSYSLDDVSLNTSYFTTDTDTTARALTFVFSTTSTGSCNPVSDTMKVAINPVPVVNAGPDQTVCADIGNVGLNGNVFNATGGQWGTSGTGSFPDPNILNATYVPSPIDTLNGLVILNLTSTGSGFCNPVFDNLKIIITPAPTIDAGPDQTVCADLDSVNVSGKFTIATGAVWSTSGTGKFFPGDSSRTATYIPSAADKALGTVYLKFKTTGNGTCNPVIDSLKLNITPAPTLAAIPNQTICADAIGASITGTVTVASGLTWTSTGTGTFAPNANAMAITYMPSANDKILKQVGITVTTTGNGTCKPVSRSLKLNITPAPTVNAGQDISICNDALAIQLGGSKTVAGGVIWSTSGTGTFNPSASTINATYRPSAADVSAGVIDLKLTTTLNGTCNPVSDNLILTLTTSPTVNAGPDQRICANSGVLKLNGSVTVSSGGAWSSNGTGAFLPNANGLSRNYVPSPADTAARSIRFVLTTTGNGTCQPKKDTMMVSIDPVPIVSTAGTKICSDASGVTLKGSVFNATGVLWSTSGSGTFSPNIASLSPKYVPSTSDIQQGLITITLTSDGNATCSPVSTDIDMLITPLPVADAGVDQRICIHAPTTVIARSVPNVTYDWFTTNNVSISNSGLANVTADSDTSFVLSVTDMNGCVVNDTVDIFVVDTVHFNMAPQYCFEFGKALDANPIPVPTFGTYEWYRNDSILLGENSTSTVIKGLGEHVIIYNYGSCSYFDTTVITPLPSMHGLDKYACISAPVIISTSNLAGVIYKWSLNNNPVGTNNDSLSVTASPTPWDTITYIVQGTNTLGCQNNDTINVIAVDPPKLTLTNTPACEGDIITLNAQPSNIDSILYGLVSHFQWKKDAVLMPDTISLITVKTTATYSARFNIGECFAYDTSTVTFYKLPVPDNADRMTFCKESDFTLELDAGPSFRYNWLNTGNPTLDINRTVIVSDEGYYKVKLTNKENCSVTDSIFAQIVCPPKFFVAESFTPDDPDHNFKFIVKGEYFKNYEIFIYNRWGEIIFHSTDRHDSWDGTYRGEKMPPGVYPYTITYDPEFSEYKNRVSVDGSVTLIR